MLILLLTAALGYSQTASNTKTDAAVMELASATHDFGKIKQGVPVTHEFKFVNKGKVPLIITNVAPSCGCTTPEWTKDPIAPGMEGHIKATYNAAAQGTFNKSITVTANIENGYTVLYIKGEVSTVVQ